jgi:DNA-binding MarR family transcriptional regulator
MPRDRDADVTAALVALRRIVRKLRLADRSIEAACGISVAQLFVLRELAASTSPSIADLAARTLTDPSSVSTVIARLTAAGLVARKPSRTDRRRAELFLTPRGRALAKRAPQVPQSAMIDAVRAMPATRRAQLVRSLDALATALGAHDVPPRMLFEDEPPRTRRRRA